MAAGLTKEKLTEQLQAEFENELPGVDFNFSQYIQDNIEEAISGVKGANSVKIVGPNLEVLEKLADAGHGRDGQVRGVADLGIFHVLGQPNLNIKVDRAKAARYGLNTGDVNTVIQAALGGTAATTVLEGDRQFNLAVRLAPEYRDSIDAIRNIKVGYQTPQRRQCLHPVERTGDDHAWIPGRPGFITKRSQRFIPIKFSVRGRDLGSTVAEAQERIAKNVKLPTGYRMVWAGEFEDLQKAKQRLVIVVPISLLLILVCSTACSIRCATACWRWPAFPSPIGGGVMALYVSGLDFSISAAIGFISLFGVSVMNGILIITYYNQVRRRGHGRHRGDVPCRRAADAADADDSAVGLHRPVAGGDFPASAARCSVRWRPWSSAAC